MMYIKFDIFNHLNIVLKNGLIILNVIKSSYINNLINLINNMFISDFTDIDLS